MKIKIFGTVISVLFTALMVYIFSYLYSGDNYLPIMIAGGITVLATSFVGTGIAVEPKRTAILNSVSSWCFCAAFILLNVLLALTGAGVPIILITNGLLLIIYLVITRSLLGAKQ